MSWPVTAGPGRGSRHANTLPGYRCGHPNASPTDRLDDFCRADRHRPRMSNLRTTACGPIVGITVDLPVDCDDVLHSPGVVPSRRATPPPDDRPGGGRLRHPPGPRTPATTRSTVGDAQHGRFRGWCHDSRRALRPIGRNRGPSGVPDPARPGRHDPRGGRNRPGRRLPTTADP